MSGAEQQRGRVTLDEAVAVIKRCIADLEEHNLQITGKRRESVHYSVVFALGDLLLPCRIPFDAVSDYQPGDPGDLRSHVLSASSELHRRKSAGQ